MPALLHVIAILSDTARVNSRYFGHICHQQPRTAQLQVLEQFKGFNPAPSAALCTFGEHKPRLTQNWILNNSRNVNYIQQFSIKMSNNLTEGSAVQNSNKHSATIPASHLCPVATSPANLLNTTKTKGHNGTHRFFTINMPDMNTSTAQQIIF